MEHPVPYFDVIFQGEKTYGKLRTYKGAQNTMTTFKLTNICPLTEKKKRKMYVRLNISNFLQAQKIEQHERKKQMKKEEKELKERKERVRKAKEAREKAAQEEAARAEMGGDAGGAGGLPGGLGDLFSDPELMEALNDPEVAKAFGEITSNPANLMKYQNNPKVMKVVTKMAQKMGGGGGGGMPGMGGGTYRTVWTFTTFTDAQILREIKFDTFRSLINCIFGHFGDLKF